MAKKLISDHERFLQSILVTDAGCWEWQKARDKDGYGLFKVGSYRLRTQRMARAHRWSYEHYVGPIPDGLQIDHECVNPCCVNPKHLQVVTGKRNSQLGWERGTHVAHHARHTEQSKAVLRAKALGRKASPETREKMAASQRNRQQKVRNGLLPRPTYKASDETKRKISIAMSGANNPFYGKRHSSETKARISAVRREREASRKV